MNIFTKYVDYLKNNPEGYWFKRKMYGWGWVPATRQGWLVILAFLVSIFLDSFMLDSIGSPTAQQVAMFYAKIFLTVIILLMICYKTGEKPKWQWGGK